ncbi:DNA-directed RNA polymerase II subunit RPB1 [Nematocida homosporus]|uniref:DNA-directed RNA polymerase II subunit RPB1 n=1 Tax=Nematocida homosporus TaxID=1912981 RepID=UPI002220871C|nr:DNA-directed RNA polymerase II subunit RPB1 [Nematocida homosporus]KAI5184396.1 DNA-directed RNA polymerase II subunit RPB1 [Nematocida homosporus]
MGSEIPLRKVESIEFGILSPEDVVAISVCKIEHPETVENGVPKEGGLADLRLGTSERGFLCSTCGHRFDQCTGHFGYIELSKPVFHIGFLAKVKKILESVCFFCSKLRIEKQQLPSLKPRNQKERKRRLNLVWGLAKNRAVCLGEVLPGLEETPGEKVRSGCGNRQPTIRREGLHLLAFQKGEELAEGKTVLSAEKALEILRRISEVDIEALGFDLERARPEWMIIRVLPVPPPQVRPSITMEGSLRCEDDLTHKLADIIKASNNLKRYEQEGAPGHITRDYEQLLQFHVATLMNNDISGQPQSLQKNGRPLKSLRARLRGKEGRVRGNLMGKRVDFSARTVITADPNIGMNEVGVPEEIAKMLTFPERVTEYNLAEARAAVFRGPHTHPGANYVIRDDGQRIDLRFHRGEMNVQVGYIVERHLKNGDTVLFNRQPSLHKMSMMAHRARVMRFSTFRLNLSVTSPYNADFDGDEMNLHLPQSLPAQTELRELALVEKNIVSPQSNRPVMGIVQDTLLGLYKLTKRDLFLTPAQAQHLVYAMDNGRSLDPPVLLRPIRLYTGKQIFSHALPPVSYNGLHSAHVPDAPFWANEDDSCVVIRNGELLAGIICKRTVGTASGGLIHVIANDLPRRVCVDFIDALQRAVAAWLAAFEGFTVGIGDTVPDAATADAIREAIDRAKSETEKLIWRAAHGELERLPGMSMRESLESVITLALNRARDTSGTAAQRTLLAQNSIKQMAAAGSKGSSINVSQMSACVGQQVVEGRRILLGFRDRALPHFTKDDFGAEARGFVSSSYITGLTPVEFFFHAMGGREGLIDTAVKTAETGYIQRRLVKALEDAQVRADRSVRSGEGQVIQGAYGGDCLDATFIEMQDLVLLGSESEFTSKFVLDLSGLAEYPLSARVAAALRSPRGKSLVRTEILMLRDERNELLAAGVKGRQPLPVPLARIFERAQRMSQSPTAAPGVIRSAETGRSGLVVGDVLPERIVRAREALETALVTAICAIEEVAKPAFRLFMAHLRGYLAVKRVLCEFRLSGAAFEWAVDEVRSVFLKAIVAPGEMVGTLAAQSIGEPATQMTLNTFHLAGVASTVTRGVPRLKEIINVAKTIKTPSLILYLRDDLRYTPEGAKKAQQEIERCYVRDVLACSEVVYDPLLTAIKADADFIEAYAILDPSVYTPSSPWVLRLTLNRRALVDRGLSIEVVAQVIEVSTGYKCMHSDENAATQIIRCALPDTEERLRKIEATVAAIMLKGLSGIKRAFINESPVSGGDGRVEYVLHTEGAGLAEVLTHPMVDPHRSTSNDPLEVLRVLGIEAARAAVLREIRAVIESDGSYVNFRHLSILADIMTQRGTLSGITRHGTNRGEAGALMRCSFEETVEILLDAAASAETDRCRGVVESVMLGRVAAIGTGTTEVIIDKDALEQGVAALEKYEFEEDESGGETPPGLMSPLSAPGSDSSSSHWGMPGVTPGYSPASPTYSPASPTYAPASPTYSPSSPTYAPSSPSYSPTGAGFVYSPASPVYSFAPSSPNFLPPRGASSPPPLYTPSSPAPNYNRAYAPVAPLSPAAQTLYTPSAMPRSEEGYLRMRQKLAEENSSSESSEEERDE